MTQKSNRGDRARLEKTLPPLRLPTTQEQRRRFERRLDARLATLARSADCTPQQCIALALWLGSQGWKAFEIDLSDCDENPTGPEFVRNLLLAVAEDGNRGNRGKGRRLKSGELAGAAIDLAQQLGIRAPKKGEAGVKEQTTWDQYARRKRDPSAHKLVNAMWVEAFLKQGMELPAELRALYDNASIAAPREVVQRIVVAQMKQEIEASAARLESAGSPE